MNHFCNVWLVEPHRIDRTGIVGDRAFAHRNFSNPGFASFESVHAPVDRHGFATRNVAHAFDTCFGVVAVGEVIHEVVHGFEPEFFQSFDLRSSETEMFGDGVEGVHAGILSL